MLLHCTLSLGENRLGQNGSGMIYHLLRRRTQLSTHKMSLRVVLMAVVTTMNEPANNGHDFRRVAFISFILHIEVSTIDVSSS